MVSIRTSPVRAAHNKIAAPICCLAIAGSLLTSCKLPPPPTWAIALDAPAPAEVNPGSTATIGYTVTRNGNNPGQSGSKTLTDKGKCGTVNEASYAADGTGSVTFTAAGTAITQNCTETIGPPSGWTGNPVTITVLPKPSNPAGIVNGNGVPVIDPVSTKQVTVTVQPSVTIDPNNKPAIFSYAITETGGDFNRVTVLFKAKPCQDNNLDKQPDAVNATITPANGPAANWTFVWNSSESMRTITFTCPDIKLSAGGATIFVTSTSNSGKPMDQQRATVDVKPGPE